MFQEFSGVKLIIAVVEITVFAAGFLAPSVVDNNGVADWTAQQRKLRLDLIDWDHSEVLYSNLLTSSKLIVASRFVVRA